ncbi:MAG: glycoside hydrolase family 20 zincin-like fold domain-containing protein [Armatimonadota bacterium]
MSLSQTRRHIQHLTMVALALVTAFGTMPVGAAPRPVVVNNVADDVLIPQPKRVVFQKQSFAMDTSTVISYDEANLANAEYLQSELQRLYQLECKIGKTGSSTAKNQISLQIAKTGKSLPQKADGYALAVNSNGVTLASKGVVGVFYGIQTLKQLLSQHGAQLSAKGCQVTDEPAMAWRGVYLNLRSINRSPESMKSMKNLINSFAALKMNTLFFEISDNILYDRQKFPAMAAQALTKAQAKELVNYAKSLHFEVIPALQMLSHAVWILSNPANYSLLEDPEHDNGWATAWCPSNPATDILVKDMLEETIEIFEPKYVHICMDEINYGPYGMCDLCKKQNPSEMLLRTITRMHDINASKGVKTMMWHDTLLPTGQYMVGTTDKARGWEIIDKLPKDILMVDWDYDTFTAESQKRLNYFTQKGFPVAGATFYSPIAIQGFAQALAKEPAVLGLFDTLWSYAGSWAVPQDIAPEAWSAVLLTGQYAWNPAAPKLSEIRYDPIYQIAKIIRPDIEPTNWSAVPLDQYFNTRITNGADSWPKYGAENAVHKLLGSDIQSGQVRFRLATEAAAKNVILLSAEPDDALSKGPVTIEINKKAPRLAMLITCNLPLDRDSLAHWSRVTSHPLVAKARLDYTDGTSAEMEFRYRWNVTDWNSKFGVFDGRIATTAETESGSRIQLIRTDWVNPYPEKSIKDISIESQNSSGMSLAVFAISIAAAQE